MKWKAWHAGVWPTVRPEFFFSGNYRYIALQLHGYILVCVVCKSVGGFKKNQWYVNLWEVSKKSMVWKSVGGFKKNQWEVRTDKCMCISLVNIYFELDKCPVLLWKVLINVRYFSQTNKGEGTPTRVFHKQTRVPKNIYIYILFFLYIFFNNIYTQIYGK